MPLIDSNGHPLTMGERPPKLFHPARDLVCIWAPPRHQSHGGLALPENRRDSLDAEPCEIIALGPDCNKQFAEGQKILIGNAMVREFRYKGHTYAMMEEKYILAVIPEES